MLKKKRFYKDPFACLHVTCTFKNTLLTLTNSTNRTLGQYSSRSYPTKIKRKNTPYVLQQLVQQILQRLKKLKYRYVGLVFKGMGMGRYHVIKHLKNKIKIFMIQDQTNIPFNGCRLPKPKRK